VSFLMACMTPVASPGASAQLAASGPENRSGSRAAAERPPLPSAAETPIAHAERPVASPRMSALLSSAAPHLDDREHGELVEALTEAEEKHDLDAALLLALIDQESRFDADARGAGGTLGLMQVAPATGSHVAERHGIPWSGAATLLDPGRNVTIGAAYLAELLDVFDDVDLSLAAYNLGPGRVKQMLASGRRPQGVYAAKIRTRYDRIRKLVSH
jgi:soluble lytic murein transglycosylase-like protein